MPGRNDQLSSSRDLSISIIQTDLQIYNLSNGEEILVAGCNRAGALCYCNTGNQKVESIHFIPFKNSSSETFACLRILLRVPFFTGLCKGTVTVSLTRCKKTWLPFCLTTTNPRFTRIFIIFCPEIIGNSSTYNIHRCNFPKNSGLFLCNLKHQFNGFFDVLKCFFFRVTLTNSGWKLKTTYSKSTFFCCRKSYCIFHNYSSLFWYINVNPNRSLCKEPVQNRRRGVRNSMSRMIKGSPRYRKLRSLSSMT